MMTGEQYTAARAELQRLGYKVAMADAQARRLAAMDRYSAAHEASLASLTTMVHRASDILTEITDGRMGHDAKYALESYTEAILRNVARIVVQ